MSDRAKIEEAKARLPLPELLRILGFEPPAGGEGNMRSPFAVGGRQKTPSFSIFCRGDSWGWCDRTGGTEEKGDEITLLEKLDGLTRAAAIARYLAHAGVVDAPPAAPALKDRASARPVRKAAPSPSATACVDWPTAVAKFTDEHASRLAEWRGYSREFVDWLRECGLVGLCKESTAFPVHDEARRVIAAHIRSESGSWFYAPTGAGSHPLIIGDLRTASKTMLFESQWDAFAVADAAGWHRIWPEDWAVVITRGASNGRFSAQANGAVYAWPQNDGEKNGKRAGEEWLREVAAHAPGEVFRVETPERFKDANDWTRAGTVEVEAAIAAALPVEKPSRPLEKAVPRPQRLVSDNNAAIPPAPFAAAAVLDELGLYWLNGSPSYFLRRQSAGRVHFLEMASADVRRKLRVKGYRSKPDLDRGDRVSEIDCILDEVTESRAVDFALNISGTPADIYDMAGRRVIVRESPRLIEPDPDASLHPTVIESLLTQLLGFEGMQRFCCWLKVSLVALRAGERRPGQALILIGPPDCGKSRIQHQIITPILGGRSADPKSYFFGRTDFNAEMVGAEHLLIEEVPSSNRHEERVFFGERIKEVVANDTTRLHKKGCDALTVSPFWRLSITLNDNPEKLRCLPPLGSDLAEKIIMQQVKPAPELWEQFAAAPDPRKAFREAIAAELPAFVHVLLGMQIPQHLQGRRYGVRSHIPEDIAETLFESEPEHHLLLLIEKAGIYPRDDDDKLGAWTGDAEDLKQALCADASSVRASASRLLNTHTTACGQLLALLMSRFPKRIEKHRKSNWRGWIIHPPSA